MCGLFGFYSPSLYFDQAAIDSSLKTLQHRGPDQVGSWMSNDNQVGIGQNRLSINDLSMIHLPFSNEDKTIHVIANAEIYNHRSLRKELMQKGHRFQTECDVEVIPHLYEEYGMDCIHRLRGEFAFIIWDENQKSLFAVRDRFGVKPLYFTRSSPNVCFASEIPPLLHLKNTKRNWDLPTFLDFTHFCLPRSKTLFSDISQIPAGHYYSIVNDTHEIKKYWDIHYTSKYNGNSQELIDSIQNKLIEAVDIRTQADVPVACYLSGGIDSSALLGIASRHSQQSVEAFTIGFEDQMVDESAIAKRTCEHLNVNFNITQVTEADFVENFERVITHTCAPVANTAGIARYLLSQSASQAGFKAVLSGEGADEVFLGYWGSLIEAIEDPRISSDFHLSSQEKATLLQQLPVSRGTPAPSGLQILKSAWQHTPSWCTTMTHFNALHRSVLNKDTFNSIKNYNPYLGLINELNLQNHTSDYDNVQFSSHTWIKTFFPNTMLNFIGDRAEMANSIEARQPYLDHELFELMASVPTVQKIKGGVDKYLLRESVKPFVTTELYNRKKFMFQAPPLKLTASSPLFQMIKTIIRDRVSTSTLYDTQKVLDLIRLADKSAECTREKCFELSYTLTNIASTLLIENHYKIA